MHQLGERGRILLHEARDQTVIIGGASRWQWLPNLKGVRSIVKEMFLVGRRREDPV